MRPGGGEGRRRAIPGGRGRSRDWLEASLGGLGAVAPVAAVGVAAALSVALVADPGVSLGGAFRIGLLYLGAFHHVGLRVEGDLRIDGPPGSELAPGASIGLELGVALLAVTGLGAWLLFGAGRRSAQRAGGAGWVARAGSGARVAPGYAAPVALVALLVRFEEPVRLGSFVTGEVRISMSPWQALVVPLAIAAACGAAGGAWSWLSSREDVANVRAAAVLAGGGRMLALGALLSLGGLFVAGVVQPEEPVALLTPSTARYARTVFDDPGRGALILAHHLALVPNEALWTLVPAMGGCDEVRGSEDRDLLCLRSFPAERDGALASEPAPRGYLLFLLVPALATVLGGRRAASRAGSAGLGAVGVGLGAGAVFAVLVGVGCLLASVSLSYGSSLGGQTGGGDLWIGPDPVMGTLLALVWGSVGGALGGLSAGSGRSRVRTWRG